MDASRIVIGAGQHRNEKCAAVLAPCVARELLRRGHTVRLEENPERRTLREFVEDAFVAGKKMSTRQVKRFLDAWGEEMDERYADGYFFDFHNYEMDRTGAYDSEEDWKRCDENLRDTYPHFAMLEPLKSVPYASDVIMCPFDEENITSAAIEIPAYFHPNLPKGAEDRIRTTLSRNAYEWGWYLYDANVAATQRAGLLGKEMVRILATGIEYLMEHRMRVEYVGEEMKVELREKK